MVSSVDTFFQHENCHHTILILDVSKTTPDLPDSADRPEDLPISLRNGKKKKDFVIPLTCFLICSSKMYTRVLTGQC